eukprot:scaffold4124_cov109-Isochrysis_galbana.AAC.2
MAPPQARIDTLRRRSGKQTASRRRRGREKRRNTYQKADPGSEEAGAWAASSEREATQGEGGRPHGVLAPCGCMGRERRQRQKGSESKREQAAAMA